VHSGTAQPSGLFLPPPFSLPRGVELTVAELSSSGDFSTRAHTEAMGRDKHAFAHSPASPSLTFPSSISLSADLERRPARPSPFAACARGHRAPHVFSPCLVGASSSTTSTRASNGSRGPPEAANRVPSFRYGRRRISGDSGSPLRSRSLERPPCACAVSCASSPPRLCFLSRRSPIPTTRRHCRARAPPASS
jgi:hypothetical protein